MNRIRMSYNIVALIVTVCAYLKNEENIKYKVATITIYTSNLLFSYPLKIFS